MWTYESSVEAALTAQAIWAVWSRVAEWGTWNSDIEAISISGPFATGSVVSMTPIGQEPIELRLIDVAENESFTDVAEFEGVMVRTIHRVEPLGEGTVMVTYRTEISGPAADEVGPEIGPQITADFPETLAALVKHAGG